MFSLTRQPIVPPVLASPGAGGFVTFDGKVRNTHQDRPVTGLEYEAFDELVLAEGTRLMTEAVAHYGLLEARCIHRVGRLEIGETAVWIGVAAPHRREAFEACEWILDQLKRRVPIWKKEFFADGDSGWIGSDVVPGEAPVTEENYYARQIRLREVGQQGEGYVLAEQGHHLCGRLLLADLGRLRDVGGVGGVGGGLGGGCGGVGLDGLDGVLLGLRRAAHVVTPSGSGIGM